MDVEFLLFLVFVATIFLVPAVLKARARHAGFDLIARALERGQTLDADAIVRLTEEKSAADRRRSNLATGIVLSALAVGALASGGIIAAVEDAPRWQNFLVPAALLGALGIAFLILASLDQPASPPR